MENNQNIPISEIVLFSPYPWDRSLPEIRVLGPMRQSGVRVTRGNDWETTVVDLDSIATADLVIIQRDFPRNQDSYQKVVEEARRLTKKVILDMDDLLLELPQDHPDQKIYYYTEAMIPMVQALLEVDAVTVSTPALRDYLLPYNSRVWVIPNFLDDTLWQVQAPRLVPAQFPVTIGYMGGNSHLPDLESIVPALLKVIRRYGERVRLKIWGCPLPEAMKGFPQIELGDFIPSYSDFAKRSSEICCDFMIAPLCDNLFNHCKSSIKFFEYTSLGVSGIYGRVTPYEAIVSHGENGLLANTIEEWEAALIRMIENPQERHQLATAASSTLREYGLLSENASRWIEVYRQILALPNLPKSSGFAEKLVGQVQRFQQAVGALDVIRKENEVKARFAERETFLQNRLAVKDQIILGLQTQLSEQQRLSQAARARVVEFETSRVFKLARLAWRIRLVLAPHGSFQEKILRLPLRSFQVLRREGLGSFIQAISRKIKKLLAPPPPAPSLQGKTAQVFWLTPPEIPGTSNVDVIVFPIIDWDLRFQRPQQIATRLAANGHRVFYIQAVFRQDKNVQIRKIQDNIFECQLPSIKPLSIYKDTIDKEDLDLILTGFRLLEEQFGIHEAVSLVDLPFWGPAALALRRRYGWKVVYDCMDLHQGFSTNQAVMMENERYLSQESNLVLVTSQVLFDIQSKLNPRCVLLPNATDFEYFSRRPESIPAELMDQPHPVIGYYGAISDWFDADLVGGLARRRPDWHFVLIGSTNGADLEPLHGLSNIHLLGEKPYSEIAGYLYGFDVCVIPFKQTPLIEATNPVKLYEYLSTGKPVVVSAGREVQQFADYVTMASTLEEWQAAIEAGLVQASDGANLQRIEFARQNSWPQRVQQIESEISALFPLASLIILTYNNLSFTRQCLESINQRTLYPNYEIIVVDNGSSDGTPAYLLDRKEWDHHLQVILNDANQGFAAGMNQGIQTSQGEYVLLLNNDIVVTSGWLGGLIHHLEADPQIGMIGPVTNATGNEARVEVTYSDIEDMPDFASRYTRDHQGGLYPLREFAMYCIALPRKVIQEIGLLDERFSVGMFEDDDYAVRIRQAGYKILCTRDVFVHHYSEATFKTFPKETYLEIFRTNQAKFEEKWQVSWKKPQIVDHKVLLDGWDELERILAEHPHKKGVVIFPPTIGWSITLFQRPHHLARALARLDYLVFFCERDFESDYQTGFRKQESNLYLANVPFEVFDLVDRPVVITYVYNAETIYSFRKPVVVFDHIDDLSVFPYDQTRLKQNFELLLKRSKLVVTTAERLFQSVLQARPDVILVPNGVEYEHFQSACRRPAQPPADLAPVIAAGRPVVGYYGALARWFDYDLVAFAAQKHAALSFVLIGPDHDGSLAASGLQAYSNVFLLGARDYKTLPDYLAWFDVATIPFVINEITLATSPLKLFEYLAAGKPVVTTALPECSKYFGVFVADDYPAYVDLLLIALKNVGDMNFRERVQQEVAQNDWTARARQIIENL
jgi:GT2 family glycosyltransferase